LLAAAYQLPEKSPANRAVSAMKVVIKFLRPWCGRASIYFLLLALFGLSYTTSTRAEDTNTATTDSDDTTSTTDTTTGDTSSITTTPAVGITAIIDTGILEGRLLGVRDEGVLEYDFVNNDSVADDEYDTRHGTIMAEIFNSVAPTERIMPLKVTASASDSSGAEARQNAAVALANSTPGVSVIVLNSIRPVSSELLRAAADKGKTIVINAGNQGAPNPTGSATIIPSLPGGIIVGGHTTQGKLAKISNRAGALKDFYIAAPYHSEESSLKGSSWASARVAGVAALIRTQNPALTQTQIAEIIFKTATDAGAAGVDDVFGWGKLNKARALGPIGDLITPVDTSEDEDNASGAVLALGALSLGAVGYVLINRNPDLKNILILDEYERPFELDLTTETSIPSPVTSPRTVLENLNSSEESETLIERSDFQLTARYPLADPYHFSLRQQQLLREDTPDQPVVMSLTMADNKGRRFAIGFDHRLDDFFTDWSSSQPQINPLSFTRSIGSRSTTPLAFSEKGLHSALAIPLTTSWQAGVSLAKIADPQADGVKNNSVALRTSYRKGFWGINLRFGFLREYGNLLGSTSGGALSVKRTDTLSGAISSKVDLASNWTLRANYFYGITKASPLAISLIRDLKFLRVDQTGLGLTGKNVLVQGDAVGFAWSQPLRTISGEVTMTVPTSITDSGKINFNTSQIDLGASRREALFEAVYRRPVARKTALLIYTSYHQNPRHKFSKQSMATFVIGLSRRF